MDANAGHTPGPWEAVPHTEGLSSWDHQDGWWDILPKERTPSRVPIASLDHHRDGHEPTRIKAFSDAILMAAAPEMLGALKRILAVETEWGDPTGLEWDEVRAIIAKAEEAV